MIDFRYHLVSLISVFLALALGIVVGTTQLNGRVLDDLRDQVQGLTAEKQALAVENRDLEQAISHREEFVADLGPRLVGDVLGGASVVILSTAKADEEAKNGVRELVEAAGGEVTGRIQLTEDYTDPRRSAEIKDYVTGQGQPAGFQLPESDDSGVLVGALLAHVLVDPSDEDAEPPSEQDIEQVLSGLSGLGLLRLETADVRPAEHVVLVATGVPTGESSAERANSLTELSVELDQDSRGVVVAGDAEAASEQGVIGHVRTNDDAVSSVSTVDNADHPAGQISTVFALAEQRDGRAGQYGVAETAAEPYPAMDDVDDEEE